MKNVDRKGIYYMISNSVLGLEIRALQSRNWLTQVWGLVSIKLASRLEIQRRVEL